MVSSVFDSNVDHREVARYLRNMPRDCFRELAVCRRRRCDRCSRRGGRIRVRSRMWRRKGCDVMVMRSSGFVCALSFGAEGDGDWRVVLFRSIQHYFRPRPCYSMCIIKR
eukprot:3913337-Rhodomonas_salina.3